MKNLVIILSHCDTEGKIKILEDKLESLNMLGLDTMLLSHCPISTDIQKQVNYFVYDESNPLMYLEGGACNVESRAIRAWADIPLGNDKVRITSILPDAGWAVFNKIMKSADLGLPLDYEYYSIINYDMDLKPSFVKELTNIDFDGDILLSWSEQQSKNAIIGKGPGLLFSILKKEAFSKIRQAISKQEYLKKDKESNALEYEFAEAYWGFLTKSFNVSFTEEVSTSTINTLKDGNLLYGQVAMVKEYNDDNLFRIFLEGEREGPLATPKKLIKVLIFNIKGGKPTRFKINGEKIIEVSSPHLEDNVRSISYLKPDGSDYSFDKEKERATELFNHIQFSL